MPQALTQASLLEMMGQRVSSTPCSLNMNSQAPLSISIRTLVNVLARALRAWRRGGAYLATRNILEVTTG
jgi:hypothetical protein